MRDRNLQAIVATLDELGVRTELNDRRRVSRLTDMDPQDVRLVLDLIRKAYEAGQRAAVGGAEPKVRT
ncbi:hypothetical protein ABZ912_29800 [Nonomuraea angiospora]|uniref:hypothetical protein n=1 Tax=Nonomuraea angiospora TaxID=46172 RepID=UPI0033ED3C46